MKIQILGTRGEIPLSAPHYRKQSGLLIDDQLLIDMGEKSFLKRNPKWILLTHLHPDHAYFVRRKNEEIPPTKAPIYAPETLPFLQKKIKILNKKKKIGPYTIIPIPTRHSLIVKSQGYIIKKGKESFFYTGDLVWIDKKYHPIIGNQNLIITEASFVKKGGMIRRNKETGQIFGHQGVPNILSLLSPFSKNFLFMHFGSWFLENVKKGKNQLIALGKEKNKHVIVGYDGLVLEL